MTSNIAGLIVSHGFAKVSVSNLTLVARCAKDCNTSIFTAVSAAARLSRSNGTVCGNKQVWMFKDVG